MPDSKIQYEEKCEDCITGRKCKMPVPCCELEDYFGRTAESFHAITKTFIAAQTQMVRVFEKATENFDRVLDVIKEKEEKFHRTIGDLEKACGECKERSNEDITEATGLKEQHERWIQKTIKDYEDPK